MSITIQEQQMPFIALLRHYGVDVEGLVRATCTMEARKPVSIVCMYEKYKKPEGVFELAERAFMVIEKSGV